MADFVSSADDEAFVVDAGEGFAGDFVDFEKVVKVSGGEILAEITVAIWVDWLEELAEAGIFDVDAAVRRVEGAVTSLASRGDAVESIAAIFGADEKIARLGTHAEEMAWFILGDDFVGEFDNIGSFVSFSSIE